MTYSKISQYTERVVKCTFANHLHLSVGLIDEIESNSANSTDRLFGFFLNRSSSFEKQVFSYYKKPNHIVQLLHKFATMSLNDIAKFCSKMTATTKATKIKPKN